MSTIKEVASQAGVSIATVSNYINGTKPVSPSTERRIRDAIEKLQYTPNISARSLKTRLYNDVGVILPNLSDPYYAQIYEGIERTFQGSDFFLNLNFSYDIPDIEENIVRAMLQKNVCGLVLVTCRPQEWQFYYDRFVGRDQPMVLIDRLIHQLSTHFVSFDYRQLLNSLTRQQLDAGKERICLFAGPEKFSCEADSVQGYRDAYSEAGLIQTGTVVNTVLSKEDAFRQAAHLLSRERPEVFLCTSQLSAIGVTESLALLGEDIPVLSLGEQHWNRLTHSPAYRTVERPAMQLGEKAAILLLESLRTPKTFEKQHILLPCNGLAERNGQQPALPHQERRPACRIRVLLLETPQVEAICSLLPHFEKTTGIEVQVEIYPHRYLLDRILAEHNPSTAGTQSDVYMFDMPWLYSLASSEVLGDITGYIRDPDFPANAFLPDSLQHYSEFEGRHYGLPFMYAPQIFYYRKDLFSSRALAIEYQKRYHSKLRPPVTWTEFNAIAEFFSSCRLPENTTQYGTSMPSAYKECMAPEIYMRLWAYGGSLYDRSLRVTFDTPQTLKAYVNYKGIFKHAKPDYLDATDMSVVSDFIGGDTAMLITYPSFLTDIVDLRRSSLTGSIGYSHIPGRTPILGGWSVGLNAKSEHKDQGFAFLRWIASEQNASYFTLLGGQPAVTSVFTDDELTRLYPWLPLYHSAYGSCKPVVPPYRKGMPIIPQDRIDSIVCNHANRMITDENTITEAIAQTQRELEQLFESYGYRQK